MQMFVEFVLLILYAAGLWTFASKYRWRYVGLFTSGVAVILDGTIQVASHPIQGVAMMVFGFAVCCLAISIQKDRTERRFNRLPQRSIIEEDQDIYEAIGAGVTLILTIGSALLLLSLPIRWETIVPMTMWGTIALMLGTLTAMLARSAFQHKPKLNQ